MIINKMPGEDSDRGSGVVLNGRGADVGRSAVEVGDSATGITPFGVVWGIRAFNKAPRSGDDVVPRMSPASNS